MVSANGPIVIGALWSAGYLKLEVVVKFEACVWTAIFGIKSCSLSACPITISPRYPYASATFWRRHVLPMNTFDSNHAIVSNGYQ